MTEPQPVRQRLVGALVLLCLAVILIPALLDFTPREAAHVPEVTMPDPPERHLRPGLPDVERVLGPRPADRAETRRATQRAAEPADDPATAVPTREATVQPTAEPAQPAESEVTGWVVQVGTFTNAAGAAGVYAQLNEAGLPVFTEVIDTPQGSATRVRVGPEFDRSAAQALMARVKELTELDPVVLRFP